MAAIWEFIKNNYPAIIVAIFITGIFVRLLWAFIVFIFRKICSHIELNRKYDLFKKELSHFEEQQLRRQINSRKYLPNTYIEVTNLKEALRFFCYPLLFCNKLIDELRKLDFLYINKNLFSSFGKKISIPRMSKCKKLTFKCFAKKSIKIRTITERNLAVLDSISTDEHSNWKARQKLNNINYKNKLLGSKVFYSFA